MKNDFRRSMIWLHTYSGLLLGWLMFAVFVTGTLSYYSKEITQWMKPELILENAGSHQLNTAISALHNNAYDAKRWQIRVPSARDPRFEIYWFNKGTPRQKRQQLILNKYNNEVIKTRETKGGDFFIKFHYSLELRDYGGRYFTGIAALISLIAVFTGIFTHRRFFRDFFTLRWKSLSKAMTDSHAIMGIITIPFFIMISFSALFIYVFLYVPISPSVLYEKGYGELSSHVSTSAPRIEASNRAAIPLKSINKIIKKSKEHWPEKNSISWITYDLPYDQNGNLTLYRNKSNSLSQKSEVLKYDASSGELLYQSKTDRIPRMISNILFGIHEASFAPPGMRFMFFILGIISCMLIATGSLLWSIKRAKTAHQHLGKKWVHQLNFAGIGGLLVAIVSYFYANRLLPLAIENRASLELTVFFVTWGASLTISFFAQIDKLWRGLLNILFFSCLCLPILDFIINPLWLTAALKQHNYAYLSISLSFWFISYLSYKTVKYLNKKQRLRNSQNIKTTNVVQA